MSNASTIMHKTNSTASSSYVMHYHMTREPFADAIEDDLFYAEPGRQQKLDILLHLTRYGDELVLVTGPPGSGKTTLLQQYLLKARDNWKIARIDARDSFSERKLLQQLFHQMNMDFQGATHHERFERMKHYFDGLQHSAQQAVLLIDNAEQLPVTTLRYVLKMAALTNADKKPLLRILFFGGKELDEHFCNPLLDPYTHIARHNINLLPFVKAHTAHYILHRLSAAHFSADQFFTDLVLKKIHKRSVGWPGEINRLAHNVLLDSLPTTRARQRHASHINRVHTAIVLTGIVLLTTLLFFLYEGNPWLASEPVVMPHQPSPVFLAAPATMSDETPIVNMARKPELLSREIVEKVAENIDTAVALVPENADSATSDTTTGSMAALSPIIPATRPLIPRPEPIKHSANTVALLVTGASLIPTDLPGFRNAWVLEQNPKHYTLQMVAGNNINTLRNFIDQYGLDEPFAIYYTTRKGKAWFGLVQHSYPDKQTALDARRQLPAALRQQNPWLRPFSALQKDLGFTP